MPAALTVGNPDASSITLYGAPFAEVGAQTPWSYVSCRSGPCLTHERAAWIGAVGVGGGARLAIERFSVDFFMPTRGVATLGLGVRLGS